MSELATPLPSNDVSELSLYEASDEDELEEGEPESPRGVEKRGTLSKWTNFFHGWQDRFVVLSNGTLSYYKSEFDTAFGCRGSMSLGMARIQAHEFDELRFDVNVNDCVYYLRCNSPDERQEWVEALELAKATKSADQGYSSDATSLSSMRKAPSLVSINSTVSGTSTSSKAQSHRLKEKLLELETFRDILYRQVDTLQGFFDDCVEQVGQSDSEVSAESAKKQLKVLMEKGIDFRGEAMTFKATMAGILATLSHCNELISRREDRLQKRLEKEIERRRRAEVAARQAAADARQRLFAGGPDYEEGPYSALKEGEFLDAIEGECDRMEKEKAEQERRLEAHNDPASLTSSTVAHPFESELEEKLQENLHYCYEEVGQAWSVVHDDGEMKVYRRDLEEGGVVVDPLKAYHSVKGVTAYELCHHFFDEQYRMEWEGTLDSFQVLDRFGKNTAVLHQVHKRVWPSSQRDVVFLSHFKELPQQDAEKERGSGFVVCNFSVDHDKAQNNGKYVRARCNIALVAHTLVDSSGDGPVSRDKITCKITYSANVNPGGWAPPSVVRAVSKREYPKFLRRFAQFVSQRTQNQPIQFGIPEEGSVSNNED